MSHLIDVRKVPVGISEKAKEVAKKRKAIKGINIKSSKALIFH